MHATHSGGGAHRSMQVKLDQKRFQQAGTRETKNRLCTGSSRLRRCACFNHVSSGSLRRTPDVDAHTHTPTSHSNQRCKVIARRWWDKRGWSSHASPARRLDCSSTSCERRPQGCWGALLFFFETKGTYLGIICATSTFDRLLFAQVEVSQFGGCSGGI